MSPPLALGLGLGLPFGGQSGQNPADWPELKLWLQFAEGAGTTLADSSASPLSAGMTVVSAGGHDPWTIASRLQTAATHDAAAFTHANATRPTIDKLATPGDKAILIEAYGEHVAYNADTSEYALTVGDFSTTVYGYGMRVRKSGSAYRVEFVAGGDGGQNRNNSTSNTTTWPITSTAHAACWYAGGAGTPAAGAAVNGVSVENSMSGAVGNISIASTNSTSRRLRVGSLSNAPSATDIFPGTLRMVRVWHFDTLPTNITDIVAEMAASPLSLPTSLRRSYGGSEGGSYALGGGFSNS